ncbi:HAD family hydrolase [Streptococcus pacificus]|uniref:HAD family hydrolase n=1 Tax=Streptococcus pacificus TaxID=2740577 RepID=A0ABS0ZK05_9STRE|nr:HAD hydrolase-like protein [Streptococcus pacificus]MBJ8326218.1 HAD family hydrolase [Streptococcus pacificus]
MANVIFLDLDGVVFDSYHIWDQVVETLLAQNGLRLTPIIRQRLWQSTMTQAEQYLLSLLGKEWTLEDLRREKDRLLVRAYEKVTLFENVTPTLETLVKEGYRLIAVTSNERHLALKGLESNSLLPYFKAVYSIFDFNFHDKTSDFLQRVVREAGVVEDHLVMVEDSWKNLQQAKNLGITTIYFENPVYPLEDQKAFIDFRFSQFSDLPKLMSVIFTH